MKLYEFFGNINFDPNKDEDLDPLKNNKEEEKELCDEVFYHIIDNDDLHKKYFIPLAKELKKKYDDTTDDANQDWKVWVPMVNSGCMDYYKEKKLQQHPQDAFPKELRRDLCKRLEQHYREDIAKGEYQLGS